MLTGPFSPFVEVTSRGEAHLELNAFRRKHDCALVISGDSLEVRLVLPQTCVSVLLPGGEAAPTPRPVCLSGGLWASTGVPARLPCSSALLLGLCSQQAACSPVRGGP